MRYLLTLCQGCTHFCKTQYLKTFISCRCLILTIPGTVILTSVSCFCGLIVFAYYTQIGCDPLKAGQISNPNQVSFFISRMQLSMQIKPKKFLLKLATVHNWLSGEFNIRRLILLDRFFFNLKIIIIVALFTIFRFCFLQILPYFVVDRVNVPVVAGIFLASLSAASLR